MLGISRFLFILLIIYGLRINTGFAETIYRYDSTDGSILDIREVDETDRIPYQTGWPITYPHSQPIMSESIIPANIHHNDFQLELTLHDANLLMVWNHDGTLLEGWGFSAHTPRGFAIHEKLGDTRLATTDLNTSSNHGLMLYDYTGSGCNGWPIDALGGVMRSPMFADLECDGVPEIIGGTDLDHIAYVLNQDGSHQDGWPIQLSAFANSFAAGNLDNEGTKEVVFVCGTLVVKKVWVLDNDGNVLNEWTIPAANFAANAESPILVDLDGDLDLEIVVPMIGEVFCYHHTGQLWWRVRTVEFSAAAFISQLAAGDVDGDNDYEICFSTDDRVYLLNSDGTNYSGVWPLQIREAIFLNDDCIHSGPAIADIDGDVLQEIIIGAKVNNDVFLTAFENDGSFVRGFPIRQSGLGYFFGTPAVTDLDLDGDVEICTWGRQNPNHHITWVYVYDLPSSYNYQYCDWPMNHRNPKRNSCIAVEGAVDEITSMIAYRKSDFNLSAFPNPFNPQTTISFTLPEEGHVNLTIYNTAGQTVATLMDGHHPAGYYQKEWDARAMPSGVYFYRLTARGYSKIKKCVLVK